MLIIAKASTDLGIGRVVWPKRENVSSEEQHPRPTVLPTEPL